MPLARLPVLGPQIPRTGGVMSRTLGRWVLTAMGWNVTGNIPNLPKLVLIAAPHTSNWDFVVAIAAKLALGLHVRFLGKDTLFIGPLGWIMRSLGGRPVDRSASHDVVKEMVAEFDRADQLVLGIAPEGTRKHVQRWRTGFYHIAHGAGVPIVPVALNFGDREVQIMEPFRTTGDVDRDISALQGLFAGIRGQSREFKLPIASDD
jgi:1-acyl-sn-glycerol-3-phosphate acyltransferase